MQKKKFVIIDPQNDFTSPKGIYSQTHPISQILDTKRRLVELIRSQDKKDVIFIRSDYKPDQFKKGLSICLPGTFGNEIDNELNIDEITIFFTKNDHSCFSSADFVTFLSQTQTDTLMICGFLAEYCVKGTAIDALKQKYYVYLIQDCIGTGDDVQDRKVQMLSDLHAEGAKIIDSFQLTKP